MRLRVLLAAQVLVAAMAGPALAGWEPVGMIDVAGKRGHDRVEAKFDTPVRQLRFTANAVDVVCRSIDISFRKGKKQKLAERRLTAGQADTVDIAGEGRILKRVDFNCSTPDGGHARIGVIAIFAGDQAGAATAPGLATAPNVVIQNSQVNDNRPPGGPGVVTTPSTNVVIQGSQVNERPPGEPGVVTLPQRNVVIEGSQVNQGQGSAPGVVMTPPACPPAQTAVGAMRQAGGAIQPATQTGTAATTSVCQ